MPPAAIPLGKPVYRVFISSTAIDLKEHRKKVEEAILRLEQLPVEMETFGAKPDDSVAACQRLASEADALVVIVAHRYGWVPRPEEGGDGEKSITWLEVVAALEAKRSVFVFLVDQSAPWDQPREQDQLVEAKTSEEAMRIHAAVQGLKRFKEFLQKRIRATFSTPDNLQAIVALSLAPWLNDEIARWRQTEIAEVPGGAQGQLPGARTWEPRIIHPLQPALHFEGRADQLRQLERWWDDPATTDRVVSLVAAGGTGKTALAERALRYAEARPHAAGIFVWSFYEDQKTEAFLRAACEYFTGKADETSGGWLERLQVALSDGKPHLLLLDGLERVQSEGGGGRVRGELDEHSLKVLLRSLARGLKQVRALVTSRFELVDLNDWADKGYRRIALDDLDRPAALAVLRAWKVQGNDQTLDVLAQQVGRHALSVSVLGSYLGTYWRGNPAHAPDFDLDEVQDTDRTAARLARVLREYAKELKDRERDLLARLATFSRGVDIALLGALVQAGGPVAGSLIGCHEPCLRLVLGRLRQQGLVFAYEKREGETYTAHPFLRDYFHNLLGVPKHQVYEVIRASLSPTLASRPRTLPTDPALLDRYDTLIEHTRLAGRAAEAIALYRSALGEYGHLGLAVGDYDRGARIHAAFLGDHGAFEAALSPVDQSFVVYERGLFAADLGDLDLARTNLEEAARRDGGLNSLGYLCVDLRHLACVRWKLGRLADAYAAALESVDRSTEHGSADRLAMSYYHLGYVEFLLGRTRDALGHFEDARRRYTELQTELTGFALARSGYLDIEVRVRVDDPGLAPAEIESLIGNCQSRGLNREIPRYRLLLGQLALSRGDLKLARAALAEVRGWTDRTRDVEVTLRAYALAAAIALRDHNLAAAEAEVEVGLHLAESCSYVLAAIDLHLDHARIHLAIPEPSTALSHAERALALATGTGCGYAWGEADAQHTVGMAYRGLGDTGAARGRLEMAVEARRRIGHPGLAETIEALSALER
jgi:tetratricopeptide (TPR) repeat protein